MKKAGLQLRLLVAVVILIALVTIVLDVVAVHITKQFMHKRFSDRISFLAKYLALNSEVGVLINDEAGLTSLAHNLLGEEDVTRVIIMDNHHNHLVDLQREAPPPILQVETPVLFKRTNDENILFSNGTLAARNPFEKVDLDVQETIGKVQIHYSTYGIDRLFIKITRQFVWVSALIALLGSLLFYFISKAMAKDLKQLATTAEHIARGDTELRAPSVKLPEMQIVAHSFNKMLDSIEQNRKAFERVNREMGRQKTLAEVGKFSLMVAHEVKNPLGIIKSSLDLLKKDLVSGTDNKLVVYIEDEIRRLNHLIEDFLLFSRPAKPTFRLVDLNMLLIEIVERFQLQYINGGVAIVANVLTHPVESSADKDLLNRSISNVLKNGCEANGDDGQVEVSAFCEKGWWVATIADQGEGIDPKNLHRIFEPFFTTRSKGTGLGLAFADQVIRAHGGSIMAENKEGGGAVFTIKLPIKGPPQAA